jgi:hypothetical protein
MIKRLEIEEAVGKAQKLSQQHFGDSKSRNLNKCSSFPRAFYRGNETDHDAGHSRKCSPGIKATDLSNTNSRRWKNFMRHNSQELGDILGGITDVTRCRYLRYDCDE